MATITKLTKGEKYTAWTTFTKDGIRGFRVISFTASRDQEVENFIRAEERIPQDRVFRTNGKFGSTPALVVSGSIKEAR